MRKRVKVRKRHGSGFVYSFDQQVGWLAVDYFSRWEEAWQYALALVHYDRARAMMLHASLRRNLL